MTKPAYQPERGDLIWLDFTPHAGTEQAGRRPALVLSEQAFNSATGLAFVCPITSKGKGSAFEVALPRGAGIVGFVLSDHLRSLDWLSRNAAYAGKADGQTLHDVAIRIEAIMSLGQ